MRKVRKRDWLILGISLIVILAALFALITSLIAR